MDQNLRQVKNKDIDHRLLSRIESRHQKHRGLWISPWIYIAIPLVHKV